MTTEARYESGHGGYTGTIAECSGLVFPTVEPFTSAAAAIDWIEEHHDKWEPSIAVPVSTKRGNRFWVAGGWYSE